MGRLFLSFFVTLTSLFGSIFKLLADPKTNLKIGTNIGQSYWTPIMHNALTYQANRYSSFQSFDGKPPLNEIVGRTQGLQIGLRWKYILTTYSMQMTEANKSIATNNISSEFLNVIFNRQNLNFITDNINSESIDHRLRFQLFLNERFFLLSGLNSRHALLEDEVDYTNSFRFIKQFNNWRQTTIGPELGFGFNIPIKDDMRFLFSFAYTEMKGKSNQNLVSYSATPRNLFNRPYIYFSSHNIEAKGPLFDFSFEKDFDTIILGFHLYMHNLKYTTDKIRTSYSPNNSVTENIELLLFNKLYRLDINHMDFRRGFNISISKRFD